MKFYYIFFWLLDGLLNLYYILFTLRFLLILYSKINVVINLEKLFENTTTYTKEIYDDFVRFHNKKYNLKYYLYTFAFLIAFVFCMVLQFCYGNIILGIVFTVAAVVFIAYRSLHPYLFIKKEASSDKVQKQLTNTYSFYDDHMEINNKNNIIKLKYYKLFKVFETDTVFYLYLNKNYSYVLRKSGFSIGSSKNFYTFIKKKI